MRCLKVLKEDSPSKRDSAATEHSGGSRTDIQSDRPTQKMKTEDPLTAGCLVRGGSGPKI